MYESEMEPLHCGFRNYRLKLQFCLRKIVEYSDAAFIWLLMASAIVLVVDCMIR